MEITWSIPTGNFDRESVYTFNVDTLSFVVEVDTGKGLVKEDLNLSDPNNKEYVMGIIKGEIAELKKRVVNNRTMVRVFQNENNEKQMLKAQRHLESNTERLSKLEKISEKLCKEE